LQAAGGQQVPALGFDPVKQVFIQQGLLLDDGLHRGVSQEALSVCAVLDDVGFMSFTFSLPAKLQLQPPGKGQTQDSSTVVQRWFG